MNQEEKVTWKNGNLIGEGLWTRKSEKGVVICHPHPQMGGTMYNNVVETIRNAFTVTGYSALRFNFRGVGGSTGVYGEGRGEKQDIQSACDFMKQQGIKEITYAGYSFGAWVGSDVLRDRDNQFESAIMISPPDKFMAFDWSGLEGRVDLIVCGEIDPFCNIKDLKTVAETIGAQFMVLKSVDHFYLGHESQLADCLSAYMKEKIKNI